MYNTKLLRFFLLMLLAMAALVGCGKKEQRPDPQLQGELAEFRQALTQQDLDGMKLTVYYLDPGVVCTRFPLSAEILMQNYYDNRIIVENKQLVESVELLNMIDSANLVSVQNSYQMDARMCFLFETDSYGKVLEIVFGAYQCSEDIMYMNGIEVYYDDVFERLIAPVVSEEELSEMQYIFDGRFQYG